MASKEFRKVAFLDVSRGVFAVGKLTRNKLPSISL
jgi:hypothetical protein